jgi:hypothetical protein
MEPERTRFSALDTKRSYNMEWLTQTDFSAIAAAAEIRSTSSALLASGFSTNTWQPFLSAAIANNAWVSGGVRI